MISVSVDMLPLPGGMGISEKLFSMIFEPVFGSALLIPGMILSRGLGYYTELLISAFHDRGEFYNRKKLKEESINKWRVLLIRIKTRGK